MTHDPEQLQRLMAAVSVIVQRSPDQLTKSEIARELGARKATGLAIVDRLVTEGYVLAVKDKARTVYRSLKPFTLSEQGGNRASRTASAVGRPGTKRCWPTNGTAADIQTYTRIGIRARLRTVRSDQAPESE